jgi:hypothetical protein
MEIADLKKIRLKKDDVLLIEVDIGGLPPHQAQIYMQQVKAGVKEVFGPDLKFMVMPLHRVRISAINVQDAIVKEIDSKDKLAQLDK